MIEDFSNKLSRLSASKLVLVALVLAIIITMPFYVYMIWSQKEIAAPENQIIQQPADISGKPDLGSQLYQKAQNPIEDKLPSTVTPIQNPIKNIYKNPFD